MKEMKSIQKMFFNDLVNITPKNILKNFEFTFLTDSKCELVFDLAKKLREMYDADNSTNRYVELSSSMINKKAYEKKELFEKVFYKFTSKKNEGKCKISRQDVDDAIVKFFEKGIALDDKLFDKTIEFFTKLKALPDGHAFQTENVFDVKYCDKRFAIIRINENHREMYQLVLYKLIKLANKEY